MRPPKPKKILFSSEMNACFLLLLSSHHTTHTQCMHPILLDDYGRREEGPSSLFSFLCQRPVVAEVGPDRYHVFSMSVLVVVVRQTMVLSLSFSFFWVLHTVDRCVVVDGVGGGYESPHEFLPLLVSPHLNNKLEKSCCGATAYGTVLHALLKSRMS